MSTFVVVAYNFLVIPLTDLKQSSEKFEQRTELKFDMVAQKFDTLNQKIDMGNQAILATQVSRV